MKVRVTCALCLTISLASCLQATPVFGSTPARKRSKSDRDLNAIGHRRLIRKKDENWFTPEKEKQLGDKLVAALEHRVEMLNDEPASIYVDVVARRIVLNSDAKMPVAIHIVRGTRVNAFTLPGGHIYLTTGLLLRLHSEGELASVLARGIPCSIAFRGEGTDARHPDATGQYRRGGGRDFRCPDIR